MGRKRPEKKRAKGKEVAEGSTYNIARKGVGWREDRDQWRVEMRPPNWKYKLHFGSFDSKAEAMVARDYGAFLRVCAGENEPDAGGFDPREAKLYCFEESPGIFTSMAQTKDRCVSIRLLYQPGMAAVDRTGNRPHVQFCKLARKDIAAAISLFRKRCPHRLTTDGASTSSSVRASPVSSPLANLLPPAQMAVAVDGASTSSSSCKVFPVPSLVASLLPPAQIAVAMDGSPRRILVDIQAPHLDYQHILGILWKAIPGVKAELDKAAFEKFWHDLPPCTYDPASIPAIDDSESKM